MQTLDYVSGLHNFREFSQPPSVKMRLCKHRKKFSIAFIKSFSKVRANLKRHNRVNVLSSKHSYRPMGARVAAQLFYKIMLVLPLIESLITCMPCLRTNLLLGI